MALERRLEKALDEISAMKGDIRVLKSEMQNSQRQRERIHQKTTERLDEIAKTSGEVGTFIVIVNELVIELKELQKWKSQFLQNYGDMLQSIKEERKDMRKRFVDMGLRIFFWVVLTVVALMTGVNLVT